MTKFRFIIIGLCIVVITGNLFFIDYRHLLSRPNLGPFLGIAAMVLIMLSMILSNRHEVRGKKSF